MLRNGCNTCWESYWSSVVDPCGHSFAVPLVLLARAKPSTRKTSTPLRFAQDDTRRPSLAVLRKQNGAPMGDKTSLSCLRSKLAFFVQCNGCNTCRESYWSSVVDPCGRGLPLPWFCLLGQSPRPAKLRFRYRSTQDDTLVFAFDTCFFAAPTARNRAVGGLLPKFNGIN